MSKIVLTGLLLVLLLPISVSVQAKKANYLKHPLSYAIKKGDSNNDGMLSALESAAMAEKVFVRFDTSADGYINLEEFKKHLKKRPSRRSTITRWFKGDTWSDLFNKRGNDTNATKFSSDNNANPKQKRQHARQQKIVKMFNRLDSDADGQISLANFKDNVNHHFGAADINADSQLTVAELKMHRAKLMRERQNKMFERLDSNNDGVLSKAEFFAFKANKKGRHARRHSNRHNRSNAAQ